MLYLPGIHEPDQQAAALFGDKPGTVVFAEAIGANPNDKSGRDYRWWSDRGFRVIVRLNNGWSPDGTIPAPSLYESFAQRCAAYVAASQGCGEWIIGNEFNHLQERPFGTEIKAKDAARCFVLCRNAIKSVQPSARVIVGAIAPWNPQSGDWLAYWKEMLETIAANGGADGISLHAYTHGSDPSLITSDHRDNGWLWHFRTYQEQLAVVPASMRHLPVDITETNQGDDAWVDAKSGWVQAAMREISGWNQQPGTQKIRSVCLYRWPRYDEKYSFADKAGVQDDFREACKQGYVAPEGGIVTPTAEQNPIFLPNISNGGGELKPTVPTRDIDPRAIARGVTVETPNVSPGQAFWFAKRIVWLDVEQSQGRHHILGNVFKGGVLQANVPLLVRWPDDTAPIKTEDKSRDTPPFNYWYNYGMSESLNEFSIQVDDGTPSEVVEGIGMGANGNSHLHTSTVVEWELATMPQAQPQPPVAQPQPTTPAKVPALVHPVANPQYRRVTQVFGARPEYYRQFKIDGVSLKGHEGLDFGTPIDSEIAVVDEGTITEVGDQGDEGYGRWVKAVHRWGETVYAHLKAQWVKVGDKVRKGQVIGLSGNTGNTDGPHLHFGLRVNPFNRQDGWGGYVDPAPYLINVATPPVDPGPFIPTQPTVPQGKQPPARESYMPWFRQYGTQFGVDWHLLAAMAYSENKYQIEPSSSAGALGLMQFMPLTWQDMQTQLGVTDPLDPEQSIKAAAYYLVQIRSYLLRYKRYSTEWVLAGYNWGMGRAAQGSWEQVPPETKAYIDEILEFSEALRRWEDGW